MNEKFFRVELMQYYEEVLAQSARNYAFTSDKKWERRYTEYEKISDKLLKDTITNARTKDKTFFTNMDITNQKLVKMELTSINFVNTKQTEKSIELLDSNEYLQERYVLAKGLQIFVSEHNDPESTFSSISKSPNEIIELEKRLLLLETQLTTEKFTILGHFASRLAHDLRNPLSVIKVATENLRFLYGTDKKKQNHFDRINRSIDRITHQVEDVLNFLKTDPIEMNGVMFSEIISKSLDALIIPDNIEIILPNNDLPLVCDLKQFITVMNNLIFNAVQAIIGKGTIEIILEKTNDGLKIHVKDTGIGISSDRLEKVFEPLFTSKQAGTGLGLTSAKSIIELHGGLLSVSSPPTVFTITLPKITD